MTDLLEAPKHMDELPEKAADAARAVVEGTVKKEEIGTEKEFQSYSSRGAAIDRRDPRSKTDQEMRDYAAGEPQVPQFEVPDGGLEANAQQQPSPDASRQEAIRTEAENQGLK